MRRTTVTGLQSGNTRFTHVYEDTAEGTYMVAPTENGGMLHVGWEGTQNAASGIIIANTQRTVRLYSPNTNFIVTIEDLDEDGRA